MLKKQICHWVQKKCNAKQYDTAIPISWGSHSQLATHVLLISLDNDPAPLLGLTDVTCCPCHVCVSLNVTPMI